MVYEYEVVFDDKDVYSPCLTKIRELDIDESEIYYIEDLAELLDKTYNLKRNIREKAFVVTFYREHVNGVFQLGIGSSGDCMVSNKDIITYIALRGATSFLLFHNHTTGIDKESLSDSIFATQLSILSKTIDCKFIGSYIITRNGITEVPIKGERK